MSNKSNTRGTRRQQKSPRTIDLEANPVDEVDAVSTDEPLDSDKTGLQSENTDASGSDDPHEAFGEPEPPKPVEAKVEKRGFLSGITTMLVSSVVGGGIALGAATLFGDSFLPNTDNSTAVSELQSAMAGISARLEGMESAAGSDLAAQLATLENKLAAIEIGNTGAPVDLSQITEQVQSANADARTALERANELTAQVAGLNETIVNSATGEIDIESVKSALSGQTAELATRIAALETSVSGQGENPDASLAPQLQEIEAKLQSLGSSVSGVELNSERIAEISGNNDELVKRVSGLEESVNSRIVPSMEKVEAAALAAVEGQKIARSVSVRSLSAVLENGGSFSGELASAEVLIGESEAINKLKAYADIGIPTNAVLLKDFGGVANSILATENTTNQEGGILSKFMSSAKSLVQVRPAGPIEGDSTAAILSRIEAELVSGKLDAAVSEWDALSPSAKEMSEQWIANVRGRIEAESLIQTVIMQLNSSQPDQG